MSWRRSSEPGPSDVARARTGVSFDRLGYAMLVVAVGVTAAVGAYAFGAGRAHGLKTDACEDAAAWAAPWPYEARLRRIIDGADCIFLAEWSHGSHHARVYQSERYEHFLSRVRLFPDFFRAALRHVLRDHGATAVLIEEQEKMQPVFDRYRATGDAAAFKRSIFAHNHVHAWDDRLRKATHTDIPGESLSREQYLDLKADSTGILLRPVLMFGRRGRFETFDDLERYRYRVATANYELEKALADAAREAGIPLVCIDCPVPDSSTPHGAGAAERNRRMFENAKPYLDAGVPLIYGGSGHSNRTRATELVPRIDQYYEAQGLGKQLRIVDMKKQPDNRRGPVGVAIYDGNVEHGRRNAN